MAIGPETYMEGGGGNSLNPSAGSGSLSMGRVAYNTDPTYLSPVNVATAFLGGNINRGRPKGNSKDLYDRVVNNLTTNNQGFPISPRDTFLDNLNDWSFSLPLNELWMVFFDIPLTVNNDAMTAWGENTNQRVTNTESIDLARSCFLQKDSIMRTVGCSFAQSLIIPQEQNQISKIGPTNRGFLKAPVLEQRQQFGSINLEFLESNLSFTDFLIRPWIILSSHFGYVARPDIDLTTDLIVVNFGKAGTDFQFKQSYSDASQYDPNADSVHIQNQRGFVARKMFIFEGCVPVNIAPERVSYTPEASVDRRDTEWTFRKYQVVTPNKFGEIMESYDAVDTDDSLDGLGTQGYGTPGTFASGVPATTRSFWSAYQQRLEQDSKIRNDLFNQENLDKLNLIPEVKRMGKRRDILSFLGI